MSSFDLISMAIRNLWKRKLRTLLTVLGVVIGTASIVVMVSVGIGMNESYKAQISEMGSLQVIQVRAPYRWDNSTSKQNVTLDAKAIESFKELPYVEVASPVVDTYMLITSGKFVSDVSIRGIDPAAMEALGYKVAEGRGLQEGDKMHIVLGSYVRDQFYNPKLNWRMQMNAEPPSIDVFNDKIQLTFDYSYGTKYADKSVKPKRVEVVGVLDGSGYDSYYSFMPLKEAEKLIAEREKWEKGKYGSSGAKNNKAKSYDSAVVKVSDMDKVQEVQQMIKDMGFEASSLTDYLESMKETSKMLRVVLGAIGGISLFVAAIGITNTCLLYTSRCV